MNCQRHGSNLKTHIRIALHSLKRDPYVKLDRLSIAELEAMLQGLRKEQRELGLLKVGA